MQEDPSVNKIHSSGSSFASSIRVFRESSSGHSTMKSANICLLTDTLGLRLPSLLLLPDIRRVLPFILVRLTWEVRQ
ncbi:hypothetical protein Tco_1527893 [Tanacetum coccineum]